MPTKIEWCDETWNPIRVKGSGWHCTKISPGCQNCYAEAINGRFGNGMPYDKRKCEFVLGDLVGVGKFLHPSKPKRIFVQSMGDLFHEDIPFYMVDSLWEAMSYMEWNTFMILTKRPERALEWYKQTNLLGGGDYFFNIWLGVTTENQEMADKRIPVLLQIPAAKRFISVEPILGVIDIGDYLGPQRFGGIIEQGIHWVIVGGESGSKRRPAKLEWIRNMKDQCQAAGVPLFVKQIEINGKVSHDMTDWPEDLKRRELPEV